MLLLIIGRTINLTKSFYLILKVNLSIEGAVGPVDIWHYDSVAYTGVVLLSDVKSMVGGKLEFAHVDKHKGLDLLAQGKPFKSEVIGMYRLFFFRLSHSFVWIFL